MSDTVMTPTALASSNFREIKLSDLRYTFHDEAFIFLFPSQNIINEENGDGDLLEIIDWDVDCSTVETNRGPLATDPDTKVYVR
jgi:hypothetical protein